jgi:hypothetical protein
MYSSNKNDLLDNISSLVDALYRYLNVLKYEMMDGRAWILKAIRNDMLKLINE